MQWGRHSGFILYICAYCNKSACQKYDPGDIPASAFSRPKWQYLPLLSKSITGGSGLGCTEKNCHFSIHSAFEIWVKNDQISNSLNS
jgi:hypothetical protein